ncbi:MAG TPA: hypothetical protein VNZ01_07085 [Solirubrobacteraceae bacterium]|nr:hypothetical protein [Solirubrobacteraceae bacterium]
MALSARDAAAAWSGPVRVRGHNDFENAVLAFDPAGAPWVAWVGLGNGDRPGGVYVARLDGRHRLAAIRLVPGTRSEIIEDAPSFAIDPSGFGVVAWKYVTEYGVGEPRGAAAAMWRLGAGPRRIQLIGEASNEIETPSVATSSYGTTVVLYGDRVPTPARDGGYVTRFHAVRFRAGLLLDRRPLANIATPGELPEGFTSSVSPLSDGGFDAVLGLSNLVVSGAGQSGVDGTRAGSSGVFGPATFARLPAAVTPIDINGVRQVFTDQHANELVLWLAEGTGPPYSNLYVSSRIHRGVFGAFQLIGRSDFTNTPAVATGAAGRFTIGLEQEHRLLVAAGRFGGPATAPLLLASAARIGGLRLAVTSRGETIATWWVEKRPGESMIQAAVSRDGLRFDRPRTLFQIPRPQLSCGRAQPWPDPNGGLFVGISCANAHSRLEYLVHYHP